MISFEDFKRLDIRVAQIKEVKDHPDADKLYIAKIDIGGEEREIVAGIKKYYATDELIGKKVVVIANLEPATIRGVESSAMLLAAHDSAGLSLIVPEKDIQIGGKIS